MSGNSNNYIKLKGRTEKYWPINYVLCQIIMTTEKCSERLVSVWNCYMKIKVVTFDDITSITNLILNFVSFYVDVDDDGKSQFKGLTYALWAFRPEYLIRRNKFRRSLYVRWRPSIERHFLENEINGNLNSNWLIGTVVSLHSEQVNYSSFPVSKIKINCDRPNGNYHEK